MNFFQDETLPVLLTVIMVNDLSVKLSKTSVFSESMCNVKYKLSMMGKSVNQGA